MNKIIYIVLIIGLVSIYACDLDLANPNAATEAQVLSSKDGLVALAIGIRQNYSSTSSSTMGPVRMSTAVTTRESAILVTPANLEELEQGGTSLTGENGYTSRPFQRAMRTKGMAEDLIANVGNVELDPGTAAGLQAWGHFFKAICLGSLAQNYTQVAINNDKSNSAVFSDRQLAFEEAVRLLDDAVKLLSSTPPSSDFQNLVAGEIDLLNSCNALLSRYALMSGNYEKSISAANAVDLSKTSYYTYDGQNRNPIFLGFFDGVVEYAPRADFGLPTNLAADSNDGRIAFYILPDSSGLSSNNLPISQLVAPFFNSATAPIPVYLPGEVLLNKAEALARNDQLDMAEDVLNEVRQKTADDDVYGIGAGLTDTYTAGGNKSALLDEIYKNRRLECFLIGTSLEDSRRFERPEPSPAPAFTEERNRNFYPYPATERESNPNTPPNPSI